MCTVVTTSKELASRGQKIQQMLRPISQRRTGPAWKGRSDRSDYVIGAHDGLVTSQDHRDWRFATFKRDFLAGYFEWWRQPTHEDLWYLHQAYLHLYRINRVVGAEADYLCLHCDPDELKGSKHFDYKRGPHMHVMVAEAPIPHAHIALHCGRVDDVLVSVEVLTAALGSAIAMIKDQILDQIEQ